MISCRPTISLQHRHIYAKAIPTNNGGSGLKIPADYLALGDVYGHFEFAHPAHIESHKLIDALPPKVRKLRLGKSRVLCRMISDLVLPLRFAHLLCVFSRFHYY